MNKLQVVLVANDLGPIPEWVESGLNAGGIAFRVALCEHSGAVADVARDADAIWVMGGAKVVAADVLPQLPKCRVILRTGSGTDNIPVDAATQRGILVANTPDAIAPAVAEHTLGLLLAVTRRIAIHDRLIRQGIWDRHRAFPDCIVAGKTLGFVGFGRIARLVATKAQGLDLRMLAYDPALHAGNPADGVTSVELDHLLKQSDFVSLHVPLSEATRHLIGTDQLRRMKPTAILINTSRGPIVDQAALVRALTEGWIAAAGLDVLETEPPPADCPLLALDNVVLTPHIAAGSERFVELFWRHSVETLRHWAATGRPRWCVNTIG